MHTVKTNFRKRKRKRTRAHTHTHTLANSVTHRLKRWDLKDDDDELMQSI